MMMPELFMPWDRREQQLRDYRQQRWRHEAYPLPREGYGGWRVMEAAGRGGGGGGGPIWVEAHHPHSIAYHPHHYHPYLHHPPRWTPDSRLRVAPTGYGRQRTHFYPEGGGNRFVQSQPSGRSQGNKIYKASTAKKKSKVSGGSKPPHDKKDTDNSFLEAASSLDDPERLNDVSDPPKSADTLLTCSSSPHNISSHSSDQSPPNELPDGHDTPVDSQLQQQSQPNELLEKKDGHNTPVDSQLKELHEDNKALDTPVDYQLKQQSQPDELLEKKDGHDTPVDSQLKEPHKDNEALDTPVGSPLKEKHEDNDALDITARPSQQFDSASPFGSIDWRTQCTLPGSLYSPTYSFSHSSSSKSKDVGCKEVNIDVLQGHETTTLSPSGDSDNPVAAIPAHKATEAHIASFEEMRPCKKRHLGWGEGLAKYENLKLLHNEESVPNNDMVVCSDSREQMHVVVSKLTDKSPMVDAFPECVSPTTPLAISCGPSPGYAKQGANFYPEDGINRFVLSRPSAKFQGDKRFRASRGKNNSRVSGKSKTSHNKKDTDSSFPEAALSLNDPLKSNDVSDQQKSVDVLLTYCSSPHSNTSHPGDLSQPKDLLVKNDFLDIPVNSELKQQHEDNDPLDTPVDSLLKEKHQDNDALDTRVDSQLIEQHEDNKALDTAVGSQVIEQHDDIDGFDDPVSSSQTFEKAESFGSIDWRTKRSRLGNLYSRRFSHSSSSISKDVECMEMKIDVQQDHEAATLSQNGDSDIPVAAIQAPKPTEACTVSSEEMGHSKKRRLGWGEGLVKYEKKKVEQTDESASKNDMEVCSNNGVQMHVLASKHTDNGPMVNAFPECESPTTPLAISCGSSPVTEVNQLVPDGNKELVRRNLNLSPVIEVKQLVPDGNNVLVKGTLNPSLVTEVKQLVPDGKNELVKGTLNLSPVTEQKHSKMDGSILYDMANLGVSSSVAYQYPLERHGLQLENAGPAPVASLTFPIIGLSLSDDSSSVCSDFVTSTDINKLVGMKHDVLKAIELIESDIDKIECELKSVSIEEHIHDQSSPSNSLPVENAASQVSSSLESAVHAEMPHAEELLAADGTYKDVEAYSLEKCLSSDLENQVQMPLKTDNIANVCWDANDNADGQVGDDNIHHSFASCYGSQQDVQGILASNRDAAVRASDVLFKSLPVNKSTSDISNAIENADMIKAKLLERKKFLQFKERVLAIKSRAFQHHWKEDIHFLSKRKNIRLRSQKKVDLSARTPNPNWRCWKRSSFHSQAAQDSPLFASVETMNFVGKLLSSSQVKPLRKELKMPALILDEFEKKAMRFVTTNGLVEDPLALEKERSLLNVWTEEEKEIFIDQFSRRGKDFTKIAYFLDHKTTAACIEFYYKNHKAEWFQRKEKHYLTNHYRIMSETQCIPEGTASSLDNLGADTLNTTDADDGTWIQQKGASEKVVHTPPWKVSRDGTRLRLKRSVYIDSDDSDSQTVSASNRSPSTLEVSESVGDETCSGENIDEMDNADWTDEEKSMFMQAVSSYGKDIAKLSGHIKTRTVDQCKIFFSKIHKPASLDTFCPGSAEANIAVSDANCGYVDLGLQVCNKFSSEPALNSFEQTDLSFDTEIVGSEKLMGVSTEVSQVETPDQVLAADGMGNCEMVAVPCGIKAVDNIGFDNNQLDSKPIEDLSSGIIVGQAPGYSEASMDKHEDKDNYVSTEHEVEMMMVDSHAASIPSCYPAISSGIIEGQAPGFSETSRDKYVSPEHEVELMMDDSYAANIASCYPDIYVNQHVDMLSNSFGKPCGGTGIISSPQTSNYPLPTEPMSSGASLPIGFAQNGYQGTPGFQLPRGGSLLQKCNGAKQKSSVPEHPVFSSENSRSKNVRLFGSTLTKPSSQQRPSQNTRQQRNNNENRNEAVKPYSVSSLAGGNSSAIENFWGGYGIPQTPGFSYLVENRIQPSFRSLPLSYRRNYPPPMSSEIVQLPLQEINGGNRSLVDGLSVIPGISRNIHSNTVFVNQMINGRERMLPPPPPQLKDTFPKNLRNRLALAVGASESGRRFVGLQDHDFSDPGREVASRMQYPEHNRGWMGAGTQYKIHEGRWVMHNMDR